MKGSDEPPTRELDAELKRWLLETSQRARPTRDARLRVSHALTRLRLGDTSVVPRVSVSGKLYGGKPSGSWLAGQLAGSGKLLGMLSAGATLAAGSFWAGSRWYSPQQTSEAPTAAVAPIQGTGPQRAVIQKLLPPPGDQLLPAADREAAPTEAASPSTGSSELDQRATLAASNGEMPPQHQHAARAKPARLAAEEQASAAKLAVKGQAGLRSPKKGGRLYFLSELQRADRALRKGDPKRALALNPDEFPSKLQAEAKTLLAIALCQNGRVQAGRALMLDVLAERPLSPYHSRLVQSCPP